MAEALANRFRVPFIKLDMSRIMDKLVGNSEKKIDQALRIVKACAPCIFLIDEVEKALGGIKSSNSSDAGTSARVFASILQFLQDVRQEKFALSLQDLMKKHIMLRKTVKQNTAEVIL